MIGNTLVVKYSLQGPQKRNKQEDVQSNLGRNAKEHVSISHLNWQIRNMQIQSTATLKKKNK